MLDVRISAGVQHAMAWGKKRSYIFSSSQAAKTYTLPLSLCLPPNAKLSHVVIHASNSVFHVRLKFCFRKFIVLSL